MNGNGNLKKKRRKKIIYVSIGVVLVLAIAGGLIAATRGGTKIDASKLAKVEKGDLAKSVVKQMLERGIIINRTHETALRMLPPYIIGKQHILSVIAALDAILQAEEKSAPRSSQPAHTRSSKR